MVFKFDFLNYLLAFLLLLHRSNGGDEDRRRLSSLNKAAAVVAVESRMQTAQRYTTVPITTTTTSSRRLMDSSDLKLEYCDQCDIYLGGLFPVHAPKYVRNTRTSSTAVRRPTTSSPLATVAASTGEDLSVDYMDYAPPPPSFGYNNNREQHRDEFRTEMTTNGLVSTTLSVTPPSSPVISTTLVNMVTLSEDAKSSLFFLNDINCGEVGYSEILFINKEETIRFILLDIEGSIYFFCLGRYGLSLGGGIIYIRYDFLTCI